MAEKAIGAVVSAGIKLMVLAFIIAVTNPVLASIHFSGPEIKLNELWSVLLTTSAIAFLAWHAPSLAAGLPAGSPSLSAGAVAQNLTSGAMMAAGVAGGMVTATRAAVGGAASLGGHAARAAGVVAGGAAGGAAKSGGGPGSAMVGASRGAASAAGRAVLGAAKAGLARIGGPFVNSFREGARSALDQDHETAPADSPPVPADNASPPPWAASAKTALRDRRSQVPPTGQR